MTYHASVYLPKSWRGFAQAAANEDELANVVATKLEKALSVVMPNRPPAVVKYGFSNAFVTPLDSAPEWSWWGHVDFVLDFLDPVDAELIAAQVMQLLPERTYVAIWN
jgi:hypothetical protein